MIKNNDDNKLKQAGSPIEGLEGLTLKQLQSIKSLWITTIEGFVTATATEEGREGLCGLFGIEMIELKRLMQSAKAALGDQLFNELRLPRPGGPTGALFDNDQKGEPPDKTSGIDEDL